MSPPTTTIRIAFLPAALCIAVTAAAAFAQQPASAPSPVPAKAALCTACHGENGNSTIALNPSLAGQTARYIYLQLKDFNEGRRHDPQMEPIAKQLNRDEMLALADYYSKQQLKPLPFKADAAKVAAGKKKSDEVLCPMCHLGAFKGQNEIPRVAGQHYDYVKKQLADFKARRRTNDAGNMTSVASTLSDEDIDNLAQYAASLY